MFKNCGLDIICCANALNCGLLNNAPISGRPPPPPIICWNALKAACMLLGLKFGMPDAPAPDDALEDAEAEAEADADGLVSASLSLASACCRASLAAVLFGSSSSTFLYPSSIASLYLPSE